MQPTRWLHMITFGTMNNGAEKPMKTHSVFSSKAQKYARYRWKYAPDCIATIIKTSGITDRSIVADIGAGTGILTKEFVGKAGRIYAIEPNPEMRAILAKELEHFPSCHVIDGCAEATALVDSSVDLVTVAQTIQWFEPSKAKHEIYRILKPGGWLAICRNYGTDDELERALSGVYPPETDTEGLMIGRNTPKSFYYCGDEYIKREFPFSNSTNWEVFLGALATASYAPVEGSDLYAQFEQKARQVFERFSSNGMIEQHGMTELYLGQIQCQ